LTLKGEVRRIDYNILESARRLGIDGVDGTETTATVGFAYRFADRRD
jgi:hypothetical protein